MKKPTNNFNLRLTIPKAWIAELDTAAQRRHCSRLDVIRSYLRRYLDQELLQREKSIQIKRMNEDHSWTDKDLVELLNDD